jgi:iron-sulfur cluster repair protein YtfE (RIC family)
VDDRAYRSTSIRALEVDALSNEPAYGGNPTRVLEVDHQRLDAILHAIKRASSEGGLSRVATQFESFAAGLLRHIEAEEAVLFPRLVEARRGAERPVSVMRVEHIRFRELVGTIAADLRAGSDTWRDHAWLLEQDLAAHNTKEERVLYPMADEAALSGRWADDLAKALRAALDDVG